MSEASFWKQIRGPLSKMGHFSRIESPLTAAGFPDLEGTIEGVSNQIELKFIPNMDKSLKKEFFRVSQHAWFRNRLREDGNPMVFTKVHGHCYCIHTGEVILELIHIRKPKDWIASSSFIYEDLSGSWAFFRGVFMSTRTHTGASSLASDI